ncbi:MAG: hypothetical protein ACRCZ9_00015 [Fusobacteriaceae bacterium]
MDKNNTNKIDQNEQLKKEIEDIKNKSKIFDGIIENKEKELENIYEVELEKMNEEFEKKKFKLKELERMLKEDE